MRLITVFAVAAAILAGVGVAARSAQAAPMGLRVNVTNTWTIHSNGSYVRTRSSPSGVKNRQLVLLFHWTTTDGHIVKTAGRTLCFATRHWHCKAGSRTWDASSVSGEAGEIRITGTAIVFREVNGDVDRTRQLDAKFCIGPKIGPCQ